MSLTPGYDAGSGRPGGWPPGSGWLYRLVGVGFLWLALGCCWLHPFWSLGLAAACLGLAIAGGYWPPLFFLAFPLLLVAGDAYLLTGQLVLQEYDALLLACLAGAFWRSASAGGACGTRNRGDRGLTPYPRAVCGKGVSRATRWVVTAASVWLVVGWLRGYLALPQRPFGDQLSVYFSHWNALRVAKGYVWGALFLWITLACPLSRVAIVRHIAGGACLAVGYVGLFVLAERVAFESLWDFGRELRVTGPFASMHVGGQHIDAFLVLAVPLIWLGLPGRGGRAAGTGLALLLTGVSVYVAVATMSRATLVIVLCQVLVLIGGSIGRTRCGRGVALLAITIVGVGLAIRSDAIVRRFANIRPDWAARVELWSTSLDLLRARPADVWLGAGMGTFPYRRSAMRGDGGPPLKWSVADRQAWLELRPGWQTYLERWYFPASHETITVELAGVTSLESSPGSGVGVSRCTKTLLHSYDCRGDTIRIAADGPVRRSLDLASLAADRFGGGHRWRPESIALFARGRSPIVIRHWELPRSGIPGLAAGGLEGSTTSAGWAFSSDEHRHFRLFNLWVHVLFEHGYVGLGLCVAVPIVIARALFRGYREGATGVLPVAVSLAGFAGLGLFGTLLDTPWIVAFAAIPAGLAWVRPGREEEANNSGFSGLADLRRNRRGVS